MLMVTGVGKVQVNVLSYLFCYINKVKFKIIGSIIRHKEKQAQEKFFYNFFIIATTRYSYY